MNPAQLDAYINLGVAYENLEQFSAAQKVYLQVVSLDPKSTEGYYNLGTLYWNQQEYEKAIDAYKMAVELSPDDNNVLYSLAVSHLSIEDWDAALPLLYYVQYTISGAMKRILVIEVSFSASYWSSSLLIHRGYWKPARRNWGVSV